MQPIKPTPIIKNKYQNFHTNQIKNLIKVQKNDIITRAEDWYLENKYEEAEISLLMEYPKHSFTTDKDALLWMGHIQIQLQQYELATEYFSSAWKTNKKTGKNYSFIVDSIGLSYYLDRNYEKSWAYFDDAISNDNKNINYHLHLVYANEKLLAECLEKEKEIDQNVSIDPQSKVLAERIREEYNVILGINSQVYDVLLNFGVFEAKEGNFEAAEKLLLQAMNIKSNDYRLYINWGNLFWKASQFKKSIDSYEKAIKLLGNNNLTLNILQPYMIVLSRLEEWEKLEEACKKIWLLDKKNMKAWTWLIRSWKENKKYNDLEVWLRKVKKKVKEGVNNNKYTNTDKVKKLQRKLRHQRKDIKLLNQYKLENKNSNQDVRGKNFQEMNMDIDKEVGYFDGDTKKFLDILKDDNSNVSAWFSLANIKFRGEDYLEAENYFSKIISVDPNYKKQIIWEKMGDIYLKHYKDYDKALQFFKKALLISKNEILYIKLGQCYEYKNDFDEAIKNYKESNCMNNQVIWSAFHIGCVWSKMDNNTEALSWLQQCYDKEKESIDILDKYSNELIKSQISDNIDLAIELLVQAKNYYRGNVNILSNLAAAYDFKGKLKEAISLLEEANNYPEFFNDQYKWFQLASYYEKSKDYSKAIQFFKSVLTINKNSILSWLHLGYIFKGGNEYKKAYKCFRAVLAKEPHNASAHYGWARVYQAIDKHDNDAIEHYWECIKHTTENDNSKVFIQLGLIYWKNNKFDQAWTYWQKGWDLQPQNTLALIGISNVYQEKKNYKKAEYYISEAYKVDKNNINTNVCYGDILFTLGRYEEAIAKYEKVNKIKDIGEVHFNWGHCFLILDQIEYAISNYIQAWKIKKNTRHDYYYYLACSLFVGLRISDSIKAFKCAIKLHNKVPVYYYALGYAYYTNKKYQKAIDNLKQFKKLNPNNTCTYALYNLPTINNSKSKVININDVNCLLFKCYFSWPSWNVQICDWLIHDLIKEEPRNMEYLELLASLQERSHKAEDAIKTYQHIWMIDEKNGKARANLLKWEENLVKGHNDSSDKANNNNNHNIMNIINPQDGAKEKSNSNSNDSKNQWVED